MEYVTMELSEPDATGRVKARSSQRFRNHHGCRHSNRCHRTYTQPDNPMQQLKDSKPKRRHHSNRQKTGQTSLEAVYAGGDIAQEKPQLSALWVQAKLLQKASTKAKRRKSKRKRNRKRNSKQETGLNHSFLLLNPIETGPRIWRFKRRFIAFQVLFNSV